MTTVTVHKAEPTPAQHAIAKAAVTYEVTDARGRVIKLKKPSVLAQYRIIDILKDSARNETYVSMVMPLLYVSTIDNDFVTMNSRGEIDAFIQRLDEEGLNAVMNGVREHFGTQDAEADREALKK